MWEKINTRRQWTKALVWDSLVIEFNNSGFSQTCNLIQSRKASQPIARVILAHTRKTPWFVWCHKEHFLLWCGRFFKNRAFLHSLVTSLLFFWPYFSFFCPTSDCRALYASLDILRYFSSLLKSLSVTHGMFSSFFVSLGLALLLYARLPLQSKNAVL